MAANDNVTGYFGQEEINLNNAATETTLKQLLVAIQTLGGKSNNKTKSGKDLSTDLQDLFNQAKKAAASGKDFATVLQRLIKKEKSREKLLDKQEKAYFAAIKKIENFRDRTGAAASAIISFTKGVGSAANALRSMDGSVGGAVGALGQIPLGIGSMIEAVFGPVAAAVDSTFNAFVDAATVGANFEGNMRTLIRSSAEAGLSLQQFTSIIRQNGSTLVALGGSTAEGTKRLAEFGKEIRKSPLAADLARLGFSTQAINEGFIDYAKLLARTGRSGQIDLQNDRLLQQGTYEYMKNLDALSKLTGKNKEALQAEQEQRMNEAAYRATLRQMDGSSARELEKYIASLPPTMQKAAMSIIARGAPIGEEAANLMVQLPTVGNMLIETSKQISATGRLNENFANTAYDLTARNVKRFADSPEAQTFAKFIPEMNESMVGIFNLAERGEASLTKIEAERQKQLELLRKQGVPNLIDPATVQQFRQNIVQKSLEMQEALAEINLDKLQEVFEKAADVAIKALPAAIDLTVKGFYGLIAITTALGVASLYASARLNLLGLSAIRASGGNLLTGSSTRAGRAAVGRGSLIRGLGSTVVRRAAVPLTVAAGAYEGYTGYTDADKAVEAGKITSAEGTIRKSAAVTGAAGGTGGALAGAAIGASIGSAIPLVGTAIGGLLGGAIGYFAGSSAGKALGEKIGETIAGPKTVGEIEQRMKILNAKIASGNVGRSDSDEKTELQRLQNDLALLKKTQATSSNPISQTATTAQKALDTQAEQAKKELEAAKQKEEAAKKKLMSDATGTADKTKTTPEQIMTALNTNIEELVRLTGISNTLAQRHIGITSGLTNDAYRV